MANVLTNRTLSELVSEAVATVPRPTIPIEIRDRAQDPLTWAGRTDPTVHRMVVCEQQPLEKVVAQLVVEKREYERRIFDLEQIAPHKVRTPEGKLLVWHCPDEFIPE